MALSIANFEISTRLVIFKISAGFLVQYTPPKLMFENALISGPTLLCWLLGTGPRKTNGGQTFQAYFLHKPSKSLFLPFGWNLIPKRRSGLITILALDDNISQPEVVRLSFFSRLAEKTWPQYCALFDAAFQVFDDGFMNAAQLIILVEVSRKVIILQRNSGCGSPKLPRNDEGAVSSGGKAKSWQLDGGAKGVVRGNYLPSVVMQGNLVRDFANHHNVCTCHVVGDAGERLQVFEQQVQKNLLVLSALYLRIRPLCVQGDICGKFWTSRAHIRSYYSSCAVKKLSMK